MSKPTALENEVNKISKHIRSEFGAKPVTLQDVQQLLSRKGYGRDNFKCAGWWLTYGSEPVGWTDFGDTLRVTKPAKVGK